MIKVKRLPTTMTLLTLSFAALSACDQSTTAPEPEPQTTTIWDMDVIIRYVQASSERTCDGEDVFGRNNPGEYQYSISASDGDTFRQKSTDGYGEISGTSHTLDRAERHDFTNQTWRFLNLTAGDAVRLEMRSTEWDGSSRDDYLNNRNEVLTLRPSSLIPNGGKKTNRALGVGKATCGLTLYYDVEVKRREVAAE